MYWLQDKINLLSLQTIAHTNKFDIFRKYAYIVYLSAEQKYIHCNKLQTQWSIIKI
jgi:hypothetical protein